MQISPNKYANWALVTLALLATVTAIVVARSFLMPVFMAFLLSITVSPIRRVLQRRGVSPVITASVVVSLLVVSLSSLVYFLSGPVADYAENSRAIAIDVEQKLRGVSNAIEKVAEATDQVTEMATMDNADPTEETVVVQNGPDLVTATLYSAPVVVGQAIFTFVLLFFLTASGDMFYQKLVQASPTFRDKKRAIQIAYDIEKKLSRYFLTITIINACLGIGVGLVLWWVGMPNPLLFGVAAFLLNFIPYLGAIAGVAMTFAIGLISFDTVGQATLAAGSYLFLTTLEGQLITPYAVGRSLKLNAVIVFIAVAFWGWAWSVIGMFVAVPALIAVRVFSEHIPTLAGLGIFISGTEEEEEDEVVEEVPAEDGRPAEVVLVDPTPLDDLPAATVAP